VFLLKGMFLCDPARCILQQQSVGLGSTRDKDVGVNAFQFESEAAEECPGGLVRSLDDGGNALAPQLNQGIAENGGDRAARSPTRRGRDEGDFDIRRSKVVEDRDRDDLVSMRDADCRVRLRDLHPEPVAGPFRQGFVAVIKQHLIQRDTVIASATQKSGISELASKVIANQTQIAPMTD
jgi:hypothetical protein